MRNKLLPSVLPAGKDPQMAQGNAQRSCLVQPLRQSGKNDVVFQGMRLIDKLLAPVHGQNGNCSAAIVSVPLFLLPIVEGGNGRPEKPLQQLIIVLETRKQLHSSRKGTGNAV